MKKITILSVGGSAEPVINAVKKSKADQNERTKGNHLCQS